MRYIYTSLRSNSGASRRKTTTTKKRQRGGEIHTYRDGGELYEIGLHIRFEADESALVAHLVTVVGGGEYSNELAIGRHLITFVLHFMRSDNNVEAVEIQKALGDVRAKGDADAALGRAPAVLVLRVAPEHFGHEARIRLALAVDLVDVGNGDAVLGEEAAVDDKGLAAVVGGGAVEDVGEREALEGLGEEGEDGVGVLGAHLALKAVDAVHVERLVVAAGEVDGVGAPDLDGEQGENDLDAEGAAVDKIAVEEVGVVGGGQTVALKDGVGEVVVLAVDVAADGDGVARGDGELDDVGQGIKYLFGGEHDHDGVLGVELVLVAEAVDEVVDEGFGYGGVRWELGPGVVMRDGHGVHIDGVAERDVEVVALDGLGEGGLPDALVALLELCSGVLVLRDALGDDGIVATGVLVLAEGKVGGGAAVVGLDVVGVVGEGGGGVDDGKAVLLELDAGEGAIAEQNGEGVCGGVGGGGAGEGEGVDLDGIVESVCVEAFVGVALELGDELWGWGGLMAVGDGGDGHGCGSGCGSGWWRWGAMKW